MLYLKWFLKNEHKYILMMWIRDIQTEAACGFNDEY